ncbi:FAD-binding oxidoreductase [Larkinella bovis]|uniref:FAD-binding oxidoreductase n=1 Tax=Larkinella bovis TaxID=683041 RepID=A0ABW0IC12_9BACT
MAYTVKVQSIFPVTHNVHCIRLEKPENFTFVPGQATEVSVNKPGWEDEKRPFTFTGLSSDPYLEFTIKSYHDHDGVTKQIGLLQVEDELIIDEPWGTIEYKGEGYFIAGGAGITPFMAILRQLHKDGRLGNNTLFFSNKTAADIIYEQELKAHLGDKAVFVLTQPVEGSGLPKNYLDESFLKRHVERFDRHFYVCGPDPMIQQINDILVRNGADPQAVVFEQ